MIRLRQSAFRHRHLAMLALALAFALRALIPQGMMPAPDAAPRSVLGITVLLCDGSGAEARLAVPVAGKPAKPAAGQTCAFAVLAQTDGTSAPEGWIIPPRLAPHPLQPVPAPHGTPGKSGRTQPPARAPPLAA